MTDTDFIEQRLRRTFQVVAEQPVTPVGNSEPWRHETVGSPSRRRGPMLGGGLAIVVVLVLVVLGVTYGPRSARVTPTTQPGLGGAPSATLRVVFAPTAPTSSAMLEEAAATMATRLHTMGDTNARAKVSGNSIVITSPKFSGAQMQLIGSMGTLEVRPVLCGAPAATTGAPQPAASSPPCETQYATTPSNLDVNTMTGQPANHIGPDPIFATVASTPPQDDEPATSVLLPADPLAGAQQYPRFVLGASQFGNAEIAQVQAHTNRNFAPPVIDVTLSPAGATTWNAVALLNFHAYLAFVLDEQVISAPLIEPQNSTFSSFGTQMEISGNFTPTIAKTIAAVLASGPLPVPFTLQSQTTTP
ncbi:MAG TPA: hypothetical protein VII76_17150 [Acidimicrobiales bacterium]